MKPYLVDVPVRVNIWIRPECQQKQFEVLKKARPSIMFLISDGGRNEKEWEAIRQNRKLIDEGIDWDCTVYRLYEEQNNGLYAMGKKGSELIWSKVDRCIFLEDDYVPSISYFRFCAELLEKYKNDERVSAICGMVHTGVWERASTDYFFSKGGSIWGMATWKRTFEKRKYQFEYAKDPYTMNLLKKATKDNKIFWKRLKGYVEKGVYENHPAGGEFFHGMELYGHRQLYIVPKYNMIKNIGCTEEGAHATEYRLLPRGLRRVFNMETYEIDFPLKHPKYFLEDVEYFRTVKRIMAFGHPIIQLWRRIESVFLVVRYKGIKGFANRFSKMLKRRKTIEK